MFVLQCTDFFWNIKHMSVRQKDHLIKDWKSRLILTERLTRETCDAWRSQFSLSIFTYCNVYVVRSTSPPTAWHTGRCHKQYLLFYFLSQRSLLHNLENASSLWPVVKQPKWPKISNKNLRIASCMAFGDFMQLPKS